MHSPIRYYLSSYGTVEAPGEAAMMSEIYARGPLTCSMATPEDFDYGAVRLVTCVVGLCVVVRVRVRVGEWVGSHRSPGGVWWCQQ